MHRLINLGRLESCAEPDQRLPELVGRDLATVVLVQQLEDAVHQLARRHERTRIAVRRHVANKLMELNCPVAVAVHFSQHPLDRIVGHRHAQGAQQIAQLYFINAP